MNSAILFRFCLPCRKVHDTHLLRCRGLAVDDYSFALGRLGYGYHGLSLNQGKFDAYCGFMIIVAALLLTTYFFAIFDTPSFVIEA